MVSNNEVDPEVSVEKSVLIHGSDLGEKVENVAVRFFRLLNGLPDLIAGYISQRVDESRDPKLYANSYGIRFNKPGVVEDDFHLFPNAHFVGEPDYENGCVHIFLEYGRKDTLKFEPVKNIVAVA